MSASRVFLPESAPTFSLLVTCGPIVWGNNWWPRDYWHENAMTWAGWDESELVWRRVIAAGERSHVTEGSAAADNDRRWLAVTLGVGQQCPAFDDPTLDRLRRRFSGLGVYVSGSPYERMIASIIGQSISAAAAAIVEQRFAAQFNPPIDIANHPHWPLPRPDQLAIAEPASVRQSGVTWRRAEALIKTGQAFTTAEIPAMTSDPDAIDNVRRSLLAIPAIGLWTVESAFLWGVGWSNAYPLNDIALWERRVRHIGSRP